MKKILYIPIMLLMLASCEQWLDVNTNPNSATGANPDDLFAYASTDYGSNRSGGDNYLVLCLMNQSVATGGNAGWGYFEDRYDISPYSIQNTWKMYYSTSANNLQLAIREAEKAEPAMNNTAAQAKLLLYELIYECSTLYGDIPYFQAWNQDYAYPEFDAQQLIFEDLLVQIDSAVMQIDDTDPIRISESDLFYNGDLDKWIRFANSLKLRILMTMYDRDPSVAADIADLLDEELISSADDNFMFPYFDSPDNENPKWKILDTYGSNLNTWFYANKNVFDFMDERNDPRIPVYFDEGSGASPGEFAAIETATEAEANTSTISLYLYRKTAPEVIYSYSELLFFKAEIYARGIGVAQDLTQAQAYYKEAVKQAMLFYEVDPAVVDDYVDNDLTDISTLTAEEAIYEIHVQHWIDLMDRPLEGWVQSRRSGDEGQEVPNLELPDGAPAWPGVMRRWPYPADELTGNINAPSELPKNYDKVWFDK
jgi:hypothetical protein